MKPSSNKASIQGGWSASEPETMVATASASLNEGDTLRFRFLEAQGPSTSNKMSTEELRESYLCDDLIQDDMISMVYWEVERSIVGVARPLSRDLELTCPKEIKAASFCERRELCIVNLGGAGMIQVEGIDYPMERFDFLYAGAGTENIIFKQFQDGDAPLFYFISYPAHRRTGVAHIPFKSKEGKQLGDSIRCNSRILHPMVTPENVDTCQLVMGITLINEGSVWNTMPPHTHARRSEIYFYFNLAEDALVIHLMGKPESTRHLIVRNNQAVLSPSWSIHSGVGTDNYGFVWAMGGENQAFDDMDSVAREDLL